MRPTPVLWSLLASGARLVVADEPTAELDTRSALGVLAVIRQLLGSGVTFVLATHDGTVVRAADELVELEHGLLRSKRRAPEPVVEHPADENGAPAVAGTVPRCLRRGECQRPTVAGPRSSTPCKM
jgi:energy-coupling factor transporter ATP-binding protein EcfA2